jgi:hypothetical protein
MGCDVKESITNLEIKKAFVSLFGNWNVFPGICEACCRFVPHGREGRNIQLLVGQVTGRTEEETG